MTSYICKANSLENNHDYLICIEHIKVCIFTFIFSKKPPQSMENVLPEYSFALQITESQLLGSTHIRVNAP